MPNLILHEVVQMNKIVRMLLVSMHITVHRFNVAALVKSNELETSLETLFLLVALTKQKLSRE